MSIPYVLTYEKDGVRGRVPEDWAKRYRVAEAEDKRRVRGAYRWFGPTSSWASRNALEAELDAALASGAVHLESI